jgi:hypothetical protein
VREGRKREGRRLIPPDKPTGRIGVIDTRARALVVPSRGGLNTAWPHFAPHCHSEPPICKVGGAAGALGVFVRDKLRARVVHPWFRTSLVLGHLKEVLDQFMKGETVGGKSQPRKAHHLATGWESARAVRNGHLSISYCIPLNSKFKTLDRVT